MTLATISTPRLQGRRPTSDDLALVLTIELDWNVQKSLFGVMPTREQSEQRLERWLRIWDEHGYGLWLFFDPDGRYVGNGGLFPDRALPGETALGYALTPSAWNRGYATEIARRSIDIAWNELGLTRLVAHTIPGNGASQHVLRKCGFVCVGESTDAHGPSVDFVLMRERAEAAAAPP